MNVLQIGALSRSEVFSSLLQTFKLAERPISALIGRADVNYESQPFVSGYPSELNGQGWPV